MDDIQNLLYLAILIIWFLSRVFSKKKPKPKPTSGDQRQNQDSKTAPEQPSVTFEDVLRELTGAPAAKEVKQTPEVEEYVAEDTGYPEDSYHKEESYQEMPEIIPPEQPVLSTLPAKYSRKPIKQLHIKSVQGSKTARQVRKMLQSPQGLKQAIILKEILDRPYK